MNEQEQGRLLTVLQAQIEDLQARLVFQDDALLQLDEVIIAQSARLEALQRQLADLSEKLDRIRDDRENIDALTDEKPPHY